jgi:LemA protein
MTLLYIVLGLAAALVLTVIFIYNKLVSLRVRVNEAWSGIEVHMKERYNLIPNLVETVKGYAKHESETLQRVVEARSKAFNEHGSPSEQAGAENMLAGALKSLFALAESYPDLKANENFQELAQQLSRIEDKIQNARRYYNGTVRENNTLIDQFPSNIVAGYMRFTKAEFFEIDEVDEAARRPVQVSFE